MRSASLVTLLLSAASAASAATSALAAKKFHADAAAAFVGEVHDDLAGLEAALKSHTMAMAHQLRETSESARRLNETHAVSLRKLRAAHASDTRAQQAICFFY